MSNIAGKAYAMNLVTPVRGALVMLNKLIFRLIGTPLFRKRLDGLLTLSMIHYARWVVVKRFPDGGRGDDQGRWRLLALLLLAATRDEHGGGQADDDAHAISHDPVSATPT